MEMQQAPGDGTLGLRRRHVPPTPPCALSQATLLAKISLKYKFAPIHTDLTRSWFARLKNNKYKL